MKRILRLSLALIGLQLADAMPAAEPLFAMAEIRDPDTLALEVLQDWHVVAGSVPTRQKFGTIRVGTLWPGQDYRVPIRFIVPVEGKAAGFHLTGGHHLAELEADAVLKGVDTELIRGGVGLVRIVVQAFDRWGQEALAEALRKRFLETLDPHFSIQYWAWPASLMRAEIALDLKAGTIDFFSNHRKRIHFQDRVLSTYLSSPYTRISLSASAP